MVAANENLPRAAIPTVTGTWGVQWPARARVPATCLPPACVTCRLRPPAATRPCPRRCAAQEVTQANLSNLPRYLQHAVHGFDLHVARAEAYQVVRTTLLEGNVGPQPSCLGALLQGDSVVRIDCFNNPEFWMEYDVSTGMVQGRVPVQLLITPSGGSLPIQLGRTSSGALRFTHPCAPAFFVELNY